MYITLVCATAVAVLAGLVIAIIGGRRSLLTPAQRNHCPYCKRCVSAVEDCAWNRNHVITFADGEELPPVPWSGASPCPGCLVTAGNFHHPDCPDEECPRCHDLLSDCSCELLKQ